MTRNANGHGVAVSSMLILALTAGCPSLELAPFNPCTTATQRIAVPRVGTDKVDLLFVVDDSGSMTEEQASLQREIRRLVSVLASGVFAEGTENEVTFPPVTSLRVGVVSTDMGVGGARNDCGSSPIGRDGRMVAVDACAGGERGPFLTFEAGDDVDAFSDRVECLANVGIAGCGFEQQLEAMLKAVTQASSSLPFAPDVTTGVPTTGHGADVNGGFVRDDAILAVVMLTDEDDCSTHDVSMFSSSLDMTQLTGLRCSTLGMQREKLLPISRYVDGLLALKDPAQLVFAAITGIPPELAPATGEDTDYGRLVGDGRDESMVERRNLVDGVLDRTFPLVASCQSENGRADPPGRIVEVAQGIDAAGGAAVVQSICQRSFEPALDAIIDKLALILSATCLPRPLNRDASGRVGCDVIEALPEGQNCELTRGRFPRDQDGDGLGDVNELGRRLCNVCQLRTLPDGSLENIDERPGCAGASTGWFYEEGDSLDTCPASRRQRVTFADGAVPPVGASISVLCLTQSSEAAGFVSPGSGCGGSAGADATLCENGTTLDGTPLELSCDERTNRCEHFCTNTAQCESAGLRGFACSPPPGFEDGASVCLNPTCIIPVESN